MTSTILIADDEPDAPALFQQQFRRETRQGLYVLDFASSGAAALTRLAQDTNGEIALMIADISLPGMSGIELLTRARAARPGLPVIMVSAHDEPASVARALSLGASLFLGKPVDFPRLKQEMAAIIASGGGNGS